MRLGHALSKELQTALGQVDDFALVLILEFVAGLDLTVCNVSNVLDDILGLTDEPNQSLVLRFEQLEQSPDSNVLESRVAGLKEPAEISVNSALRLRPVLYKDGVITNYYY